MMVGTGHNDLFANLKEQLMNDVDANKLSKTKEKRI